jgi:Ca2+-binding EF-hand superfamily protein
MNMMKIKLLNIIMLGVIASSASAGDTKSFYFADLDKDGQISFDEYVDAQPDNPNQTASRFTKEGKLIDEEVTAKVEMQSNEKLKRDFTRRDLNKDGFIQDDEYYPNPKGALAFAAVDTNKDGKVSKEEIVEAAPENRKNGLSHMVKRLDQDFDNLLDFDEYVGRPYFEVELKEYAASIAAKDAAKPKP